LATDRLFNRFGHFYYLVFFILISGRSGILTDLTTGQARNDLGWPGKWWIVQDL